MVGGDHLFRRQEEASAEIRLQLSCDGKEMNYLKEDFTEDFQFH
jgi:hypothetical protein